MGSRGPAVGATCSVCNHPDRAAIEEKDRRGVSRRQLARDYQLGKDALGRHFYGGHALPAEPEELPDHDPDPEDELPDDASEVDRLRTLRGQLEKSMAADPRSDTAREIRQLSQRIGELQGDYRPKTVGVEDVRGLKELVAAWADALRPFPEARDAMLEVTRRVAPELLS